VTQVKAALLFRVFVKFIQSQLRSETGPILWSFIIELTL